MKQNMNLSLSLSLSEGSFGIHPLLPKNGNFGSSSRSPETIHWKYRNNAYLIKSHTYAAALAGSYYRHKRRRRLVIAHGIAARMRNRRGLFRERARSSPNRKSRFLEAATRRGRHRWWWWWPRCCDTNGVRSYNPARCKKGKACTEGTEVRNHAHRALRNPRTSDGDVFPSPLRADHQADSGWPLSLLPGFLLSKFSKFSEEIQSARIPPLRS